MNSVTLSHRRTKEIRFTASRSKKPNIRSISNITHLLTDNIGQQVLRVLEEKAAEGVEVRILYDAFGSPWHKSKRFQSSNQNGGHVHTFVTSQKHCFVSD